MDPHKPAVYSPGQTSPGSQTLKITRFSSEIFAKGITGPRRLCPDWVTRTNRNSGESSPGQVCCAQSCCPRLSCSCFNTSFILQFGQETALQTESKTLWQEWLQGGWTAGKGASSESHLRCQLRICNPNIYLRPLWFAMPRNGCSCLHNGVAFSSVKP